MRFPAWIRRDKVPVGCGAPAGVVALAIGSVGPLATASGCIAGGRASDRLGAWAAYIVMGVLLAGVALGMAAAPRTLVVFAAFSVAYQFVFGCGTGALAGLVFATIGSSAGSTKCAALFGLSSAPVWYMTLADGWAHDRFGPRGMLETDAAAALIGLAALACLALAVAPAARNRLHGSPLGKRQYGA